MAGAVEAGVWGEVVEGGGEVAGDEGIAGADAVDDGDGERRVVDGVHWRWGVDGSWCGPRALAAGSDDDVVDGPQQVGDRVGRRR